MRPSRTVRTLVACLVFACGFAPRADAQTAITEPQLTDLNWTAAGSPYQLDGFGFFVAEGDTLTIGPGVRVELGWLTYFTMNGSIVVEGTEAEPVVFTRLTDDLWSWILIDEDAEEASFTHTIFEDGWTPIFANTDVTLERCTFRSSTPLGGVQVATDGGVARISGSKFEITGGSIGILARQSGSALVYNSVIRTGTGSAMILSLFDGAAPSAIVNSTLVGANTTPVAAISIEYTDPLAPVIEVENNIFVGYDVGVSQLSSEGESISYASGSTNNFWNTEVAASDGVILDSNLFVDPLFVGQDDFHLQLASGVIDRATPQSEIAEDLEGNPRPLGFGWDLGAYEHEGVCGDGVVNQESEVCDDGNTSEMDNCLMDCRRPRCGDGLVNRSREQCDDGNLSNLDGCTNRCMLPACGDGIVNGDDEQCDDGNADEEDECTAQCSWRGRGTRSGGAQGGSSGCALGHVTSPDVALFVFGFAGLIVARRSRRRVR